MDFITAYSLDFFKKYISWSISFNRWVESVCISGCYWERVDIPMVFFGDWFFLPVHFRVFTLLYCTWLITHQFSIFHLFWKQIVLFSVCLLTSLCFFSLCVFSLFSKVCISGLIVKIDLICAYLEMVFDYQF